MLGLPPWACMLSQLSNPPSRPPAAERARAEAEEAERLAKSKARHSASNLAKLGSDAARMAAAAAGAAPGALAVVAPGMTLEQVIREAQVGLLVCLWSGCVWGGSCALVLWRVQVSALGRVQQGMGMCCCSSAGAAS